MLEGFYSRRLGGVPRKLSEGGSCLTGQGAGWGMNSITHLPLSDLQFLSLRLFLCTKHTTHPQAPRCTSTTQPRIAAQNIQAHILDGVNAKHDVDLPRRNVRSLSIVNSEFPLPRIRPGGHHLIMMILLAGRYVCRALRDLVTSSRFLREQILHKCNSTREKHDLATSDR